MSLEPLSSSFLRFSNRHELTKRLQATEIVRIANKIAAGRFKAVSFRAGVLNVLIEDPADRYLLNSQLKDLILNINQELNQELIVTIKFRLG